MAALTEYQAQQVRDLLAELVRIPSVNENKEHGDRNQSEREVSNYVEKYLSRIGMTVRRFPHAPGRDNLVAHWPDQTGTRTFAFQAHMDTVSTENMSVAPFAAEIHDGKMWGRGTCDTKGSLAAFLTALSIARERSLNFVDKVYFVATVAEETGCKGAESLVESGFKVDAIAVGEPTGCKVITAHKGTCWACLEAAGKSCHGSLPHLGRNAIYAMAKAISFMENDYIPSLSNHEHPLLGSPTLSVGRIEGGVAANIVPASCRAELDFRTLPEQRSQSVHDDFLERLREAVKDESYALTNIHAQPGMDTPVESPWVQNLLRAASRHTGQSKPEGVNYYADSGPFNAAGMTCIVFGPGDIAQAHTAAEFLELDELYRATEIALDWLELATAHSLVA